MPGTKLLYKTITPYDFECLINEVSKTRQKIFHENPAPPRTALYGFLAPFQNLQKTNDRILRKCLDRKKDGRTEGRKGEQTLFVRTLPATAGGPKILQSEWLRVF